MLHNNLPSGSDLRQERLVPYFHIMTQRESPSASCCYAVWNRWSWRWTWQAKRQLEGRMDFFLRTRLEVVSINLVKEKAKAPLPSALDLLSVSKRGVFISLSFLWILPFVPAHWPASSSVSHWGHTSPAQGRTLQTRAA